MDILGFRGLQQCLQADDYLTPHASVVHGFQKVRTKQLIAATFEQLFGPDFIPDLFTEETYTYTHTHIHTGHATG